MLAAIAAVGTILGAREASAEDRPGIIEPARYSTTLSVGAPLRLTRNQDFDQGALAPVYLDALGGYVLSAGHRDARVRQGVGVGLSLNLSEDGGFTEPVGVGRQVVIMPSYLLYWTPTAALFGLGHLGVPILASGGRSAGVELAVGMGHRLLAGFGLYAEAALTAFLGAGSTVHPSASLEAGVFLEHEVLP